MVRASSGWAAGSKSRFPNSSKATEDSTLLGFLAISSASLVMASTRFWARTSTGIDEGWDEQPARNANKPASKPPRHHRIVIGFSLRQVSTNVAPVQAVMRIANSLDLRETH